MHLFAHEAPYDRNRDGRLDAGEYAQWELGNPRKDSALTLTLSLSGEPEEPPEEDPGWTPPTGVDARQALARGDLGDPEALGLCEAILLEAYPQVCEPYDPEDLPSWKQLVRTTLDRDPALGLSMWRTLLDCARPVLPNQADTAAALMPNLIRSQWLSGGDAFHLLPFVQALEDEDFARLCFQSAYVGGLQFRLLSACCQLHRQDLGQQCLALLTANPLPQQAWHMPLRRFQALLNP